MHGETMDAGVEVQLEIHQWLVDMELGLEAKNKRWHLSIMLSSLQDEIVNREKRRKKRNLDTQYHSRQNFEHKEGLG